MKRFQPRMLLLLALIFPLARRAEAGALKPAARVPWERIDAGLAQLAAGDAKAAEATFEKARSGDDSGLAGLLMKLSAAYVAYDVQRGSTALATSRQDLEWLDAARRHSEQLHIPPAVFGDALARVRQRLEETPAQGPAPALLRPLLCHLRLLSRDHATDKDPVLEPTGTSSDLGALIRPQPLFAPPPIFTGAAIGWQTQGDVAIEMVIDSEGCPRSARPLQSLPNGLSEQTRAILRWWAFEPAQYAGKAVGWKLVHVTRFVFR
jgi:hypothetical protein